MIPLLRRSVSLFVIVIPVLVLVAAGAIAPILHADEVRLTDGRVLVGEVVSAPEAEQVEIKVRAHGIAAVMHFARTQVKSVTYGVSQQQRAWADFSARRTALAAAESREPQPLALWWSLADEAKAMQELPTMRDIAKLIIARDPSHAQAQTALGKVEQDSRWMTVADAAAARGEVYFRNTWVKSETRDAVLAEEERLRIEAAEKAKQQREERLAKLDVQKKEAEARAAEAEARRAATPPAPVFIYSVIQPRPIWTVPVCTTPTPLPWKQPRDGFSFQANGQNGNTTWGVQYR